MNPIALRLHEAALTIESSLPEIAAVFEIAEREIIRLEDEVRRLTPPKPKHLVMICGRDCYPGDAVCNNYCNAAPQKGPMADHPPHGPDWSSVN